MNKETENAVRVCKNKKCSKPLPAGYQYDYCEACRNKQAQNGRRAAEIAASVAVAAVGVVVKFATCGKIDIKK